MATEIRNNREQCRYELAIDDQLVGIADYRVVGEVVVFPHTEIERARRGQGLGAQLVQYALDDVRVRPIAGSTHSAGMWRSSSLNTPSTPTSRRDSGSPIRHDTVIVTVAPPIATVYAPAGRGVPVRVPSLVAYQPHHHWACLPAVTRRV